jgi:hypothetical protein
MNKGMQRKAGGPGFWSIDGLATKGVPLDKSEGFVKGIVVLGGA